MFFTVIPGSVRLELQGVMFRYIFNERLRRIHTMLDEGVTSEVGKQLLICTNCGNVNALKIRVMLL